MKIIRLKKKKLNLLQFLYIKKMFGAKFIECQFNLRRSIIDK